MTDNKQSPAMERLHQLQLEWMKLCIFLDGMTKCEGFAKTTSQAIDQCRSQLVDAMDEIEREERNHDYT